jgi:putative membrane protein
VTINDPAQLRDLLAVDRTVLANERTLLAYLRTMLAFLAAGVTLIQFLDSWWATAMGWLSLATGVLLFAVGLWRYRRVQRHLKECGTGAA